MRIRTPHRWILLFALLFGSAWVFLEVADEVTDGESRELDERVLLALRATGDPSDPIGPRWLEEMMRDFTALGGVGVTFLLTSVALIYLCIEKKRDLALLIAVAVLGGVGVSMLLKFGFDRPRPDLVPHGSHVYTKSFPSGHAMTSAVTYLTLGLLLSRTQKRRLLRYFFLGVAVILTVLVGVSRIYLGVHWPTDVVAGWSAGAFWALLSLGGAEALSIRTRRSLS